MAGNSGTAAKRRRGPGRPFQPWQSGNPNGNSKAKRKAAADLREALSALISAEEAAEIMVSMAREARGPYSSRWQAILEIADRLWGKVKLDIHDSEAEAGRADARERLRKLLAVAAESDDKDAPAV